MDLHVQIVYNLGGQPSSVAKHPHCLNYIMPNFNGVTRWAQVLTDMHYERY
jgi:hypothetical protein